MPFLTHEKNDLVWLTSSMLEGVRHGFSTRRGGVSSGHLASLNLRGSAPSGDSAENTLENYRRFCSAVGVETERVVLSKQVHETTVRLCTAADAGKGLFFDRDYTADALITNEPDLPLVVFSADCGIILLYDPVHEAAGAIHAGWRGCAAGIVEKTVRAMQENFSSDPGQLLAAVGPCIGQCCFETDADVPDAMRSALGAEAEPFLERRGAKWHVDLAGLNRAWLLRAGLDASHIDESGVCSACLPDLYWSHRKMGDQRGAQVAMIALRR